MTAAPGPRSRRSRSEANYGPQRGTTYLIHFARPYRHARHYKGWTPRPVEERFADHVAGRGALLTRLVAQAGIPMTLARVWPNTTKDREDCIKHRGGAKKICPECGVKPAAPRLASDRAPEAAEAPDRRPMWMADRDGQWDDGTPIIYDPDQTWEQARAIRAAMQIPEPDPAGQAELAAMDELQRQWTSKEEQVGLRDAVARAVDKVRAPMRERAARAEADRLWAIADELDRQMGRQPGYQYELTAERAARIRAQIGEDLVQDARAQSSAEGRSHEPQLQGAERDAEINRLADAFPEPGIGGTTGVALSALSNLPPDLVPAVGPAPQAGREPAEPLLGPRPDGTYADAIDSDIAARAGEAEQLAAAQPDLSAEEIQAFQQAERERWAQVDRDTEYAARQAAQYYGPAMADLLGIGPGDAVRAPGPEPGDDADPIAAWNTEFAAGHVPDERDGASPQEVAAWEAWAWEQGERERAQDRADSDRRWAEIEAAHNEADPEGGVAVFGDGVEAPGPEPGKDAATWSAATGDVDPDAEVSDFPYLTERPAEPAPEPGDGALQDRAAYAEAVRQAEARALARQHIAQEEHDAAGVAAAREEANAARQARLATQAEAYEAAAALQEAALDETPAQERPAAELRAEAGLHPEPVWEPSAGSPWQSWPTAEEREQYERDRYGQPDEPSAGAASWSPEADAPDHLYGAPECAEADPEGAHFDDAPGEPMDAGRWPVLQADYGRMYIGPDYQAEAI
jgi:hypothetical protein